MHLQEETVGENVLKVRLEGAFDIEGARQVEMPFSLIAGSATRVIVDVSGVSFLASIGIRTLLTAAKGVARRGGAMALYAPQPQVMKVIVASGLDQIVHVVGAEADALAAVG